MNMAAMPVTIVKALRERGYEAAHIQYVVNRPNRLAYELDRIVPIGGPANRVANQTRTVAEVLDEGFDIFHFWNRSLTYRTDYGAMSGMDIPLIKARGRKIGYRFTGFDLRLPSRDLAVNPHSPFRYDQRPFYDEDLVKAYQDFLREHVDRFFVQDPELGQFWPDAEIIPRALDLDTWRFVGVERRDRPRLVHAPTNPTAKGTPFVLRAIERLKAEGLNFDFQLIQGMSNADAREAYRQADVIIDQILIGATGVLTLEAWALGKPVVVNLRRDLFEPFYETNDLPVVNANPDNIESALRRIIKDADHRLDLAKRGRALVEQRHDIRQVIQRFMDVYDDMHRKPARTPTGDGDLRYLAMQMQRAERLEGETGRFVEAYRATYRRERAIAPLRAGAAASDLGLTLQTLRRETWPLIGRDIQWLRRRMQRRYYIWRAQFRNFRYRNWRRVGRTWRRFERTFIRPIRRLF